jgi:hypothetical protein
MEHCEEIALDTAEHKPAKWLRYVEDTFVVWTHGPAIFQQFLHHFKSLRPTIKFTAEVEVTDTFPVSDVLVMKRGANLVKKLSGNLLTQEVIYIQSPSAPTT